MIDRKPNLDDPEYARFAWGRFRRLMAWMALVTLVVIGAALWILEKLHGPMPIHMVIATILGVGLTLLLGTALMGLVFLSSGTGHDEQIQDYSRDDEDDR